MTGSPDISVVFETENEEPNHRIRLTDVMGSWLRQTARARVAEWIVVSPRRATPEETALLARAPARWIEKAGTRYYGLKNEGIRLARGRFIALADSDALPADDWLERALEVLERSDPGVALLTGRSRYLPGPFPREMVIAQLPNHADCRTTRRTFSLTTSSCAPKPCDPSSLPETTCAWDPTRTWPDG